MAAAQKVFDTNELLEIILCHVEPHQLPDLKRVNKTWRATIKCKAVQRERAVPRYVHLAENSDMLRRHDKYVRKIAYRCSP